MLLDENIISSVHNSAWLLAILGAAGLFRVPKEQVNSDCHLRYSHSGQIVDLEKKANVLFFKHSKR